MVDTVYEYVHQPTAEGETVHLVRQFDVAVDGVNAKTLCGRPVVSSDHKTASMGDETISCIRATCNSCRRSAGVAPINKEDV